MENEAEDSVAVICRKCVRVCTSSTRVSVVSHSTVRLSTSANTAASKRVFFFFVRFGLLLPSFLSLAFPRASSLPSSFSSSSPLPQLLETFFEPGEITLHWLLFCFFFKSKSRIGENWKWWERWVGGRKEGGGMKKSKKKIKKTNEGRVIRRQPHGLSNWLELQLPPKRGEPELFWNFLGIRTAEGTERRRVSGQSGNPSRPVRFTWFDESSTVSLC